MPRHDGHTRRESHGQRRRRRRLLERMAANADAMAARQRRKADRRAAQLARTQAEDVADRKRYRLDGLAADAQVDTSESARWSVACADCGAATTIGQRCKACHAAHTRRSGTKVAR